MVGGQISTAAASVVTFHDLKLSTPPPPVSLEEAPPTTELNPETVSETEEGAAMQGKMHVCVCVCACACVRVRVRVCVLVTVCDAGFTYTVR